MGWLRILVSRTACDVAVVTRLRAVLWHLMHVIMLTDPSHAHFAERPRLRWCMISLKVLWNVPNALRAFDFDDPPQTPARVEAAVKRIDIERILRSQG
jgi:hypothetical protein